MIKEKLKKLSDNTFLYEKEGTMHVPALFFLNEKLLALVEESAMIQAKNVASLPGIYKHAIAMPDMHVGYGFPIGGVAAFDAETGIISPGGVGFDINCLPAGTDVLSDLGYTRPIESFEEDFIEIEQENGELALKTKSLKNSLLSFDAESKRFLNKTPSFFMKKKHAGNIIRIRTRLGYSIDVTGDHPILTAEGMREARELGKGEKIAVYPFKGVAFEEWAGVSIEADCFTAQEKSHLEKHGLLPFSAKNENVAIIARLFGYLLGDGLVYVSGKKGIVHAYGQEEDLEEIKEDFARLGFSARIYGRERDCCVPTRYGDVRFNSLSYDLHVSSNALVKILSKLGFPLGNKTSKPYVIPDWIMKAPLWVKRLFLSGFFGAELSKPRTHTKTGFDCPVVSMNKNTHLGENAREFLIQLMQLLEEFGIETHQLCERDDFVNKSGPTTRFKLNISSQENNLLRLYENIGFSYNKKRQKLSHLAILYMKEKHLLTEKRRMIALKTKELKKKGLTLREVQRTLSCSEANDRFIERHYYGEAGWRLSLDFVSFEEYVNDKENQDIFFDEIITINMKQYEGWVYDFTIPGTHNFIAESVIVSNCGVRLLSTNLKREEVAPKIKELLEALFRNVPSGMRGESTLRLTDAEMEDVLNKGAKWCIGKNIGNEDDLIFCEEQGSYSFADSNMVSQKAKARGKKQLGTLGSGNHFLEVQYIDQIFNKETGEAFKLHESGQVVVMIHCGSRGLGHQVCSDYIRLMEDAFPEIRESIPDKDLIYAPANSDLGKKYFKAMCAAANFAWANRHTIAHQVRKSFRQVFGDKVELKTVYDVSHNMAKLEEHEIDGKMRKVYLHRKGATRAFGPGRKEIPLEYQETGQPIILPGSMGTASYVLVGTETGMQESFGSTAHGAGRTMSRHAALDQFRGETLKNDLEKQGIFIKAASWKGIAEEAPKAYKDVDEVVKVSHEAGIGNMVARMKPIGVVKG
ncbi:MAG: RtcB family protein [Nanoarchaeota archaeon]